MPDESVTLAMKGMLVAPGDHFDGRYEAELKFSVESLEPVREALVRMNAVPFTLGNTETDIFLDFPDNRLARNGQSHVLRQMSPSGRVLWISKGPAKDECVAMDLPEFSKASMLLKSLGFVETMQIRKNRDIYFVDQFHVTLDDVAGLGTFVEIAVMTDEQNRLPGLRIAVGELARDVGLSDDQLVHSSYREMLSN